MSQGYQFLLACYDTENLSKYLWKDAHEVELYHVIVHSCSILSHFSTNFIAAY